ncbi:hypothetical protein TSUD_387110 [Trifolium subterraneum]|uniref:Uncharacterized protein n=1 Tax=Trifolium subterraneum TaxID=3900 RepID=A0A2Z6PE18_TRISU|nr:hypothetical protein TSUD_387110 [Trifolium subterraneum]
MDPFSRKLSLFFIVLQARVFSGFWALQSLIGPNPSRMRINITSGWSSRARSVSKWAPLVGCEDWRCVLWGTDIFLLYTAPDCQGRRAGAL